VGLIYDDDIPRDVSETPVPRTPVTAAALLQVLVVHHHLPGRDENVELINGGAAVVGAERLASGRVRVQELVLVDEFARVVVAVEDYGVQLRPGLDVYPHTHTCRHTHKGLELGGGVFRHPS